MRRLAAIATAAALLLLAPLAFGQYVVPAPSISPLDRVGQCLGTPVLLGTIDFTGTSKTQATATTTFATSGFGLSGKTLLLQPTEAVYIRPGTSSSVTAAAATSVLLQRDERVCFHVSAPYTHLAAVRSATSGNLLVFEML